VEILFQESFAASIWPTEAGSLAIISKTAKDRFELLHVQSIELKGRAQPFLRNQILASKHFLPLDPVALRANISSSWGAFFTQHILKLHEQLGPHSGDVIADTVWRYSTLTAWGEASAAREISLDLGVPVRTIQNRLRIARERGILKSPGPGSRLGR